MRDRHRLSRLLVKHIKNDYVMQMTEIPLPEDYGEAPKRPEEKGFCERCCTCSLQLICFLILILVLFVLIVLIWTGFIIF
jgi:hypothetical protein